MRLARGYPALREQHHNLHARPAVERRGHRAAGIAGGRDQDRQRAFSRLRQSSEAGGQESRADVLERGRRAVEKLEQPRASLADGKVGQRHRECERLRDDVAETGGQRGILEKRLQQSSRDLVQGPGTVEVAGFEPRQFFRQVEPAIRCDTLLQRLRPGAIP